MRFIIFIISVLLFGYPMGACAQRSFQKTDWVFSLGRSFELLQTRVTEKSTASQELSAAAAGVWNLDVEKGITDWLSVGFSWRASRYLTEIDSASGRKPDIFGRDYILFSNFHWLRKKRFDGVAGLAYGFSEFLFRTNDVNESAAYGGGSSFHLFVKPRWFFFKHYGLFLQLGYNYINYGSIKVWDKFTDERDFLRLEGSGGYIGIGLNFSLGKRV